MPLSLLKVNPIEIEYRSALKDEELKHATFASSLLIRHVSFSFHPLSLDLLENPIL
jgi:hypothetical protein